MALQPRLMRLFAVVTHPKGSFLAPGMLLIIVAMCSQMFGRHAAAGRAWWLHTRLKRL